MCYRVDRPSLQKSYVFLGFSSFFSGNVLFLLELFNQSLDDSHGKLFAFKGVLGFGGEWDSFSKRRHCFHRCPQEAHWKSEVKDLKTKNYLFQALDRSILETILNKDTTKNIWDSMKQKYQGSTRVKRAHLQALREEFEMLHMKGGESVNEYLLGPLA